MVELLVPRHESPRCPKHPRARWLRDRVTFAFEDLGEHQVKNMPGRCGCTRFRDDLGSIRPAQAGYARLLLPDKTSISPSGI